MIDTSDEWIVSRTGILEQHIADFVDSDDLSTFPYMCFDISAAYTGLLYGIGIVHALLVVRHRRTALLIGAEFTRGQLLCP